MLIGRLSFSFMLSPLAHGLASSTFASKLPSLFESPAYPHPPSRSSPSRCYPKTAHEECFFSPIYVLTAIYIYTRVYPSLAHTQHAVNWDGPGGSSPRLRLLLLSDVDLASAGRVVEWTIEE